MTNTDIELGKVGKSLVSSVLADFELADHEIIQLHAAARCADLIERLEEHLADSPLIQSSPSGDRIHPAAVELRQQKALFSRLCVSIGLPSGEEESQARGPRGVYKPRSA